MAALRHAWGEVFEVPPTTSAADLLRLPDDGYQHELYQGVPVREMGAPGHGEIAQRLDETQTLTSALLPGFGLTVRAIGWVG